MSFKEIAYRMAFLLPMGSNRRLVAEETDGRVRVTVDVHGLTANQAKRLINNIIAMIRRSFELIVIHGYHHGTAIRDMIYTDLANPKIESKHLEIWNPGITVMRIA